MTTKSVSTPEVSFSEGESYAKCAKGFAHARSCGDFPKQLSRYQFLRELLVLEVSPEVPARHFPLRTKEQPETRHANTADPALSLWKGGVMLRMTTRVGAGHTPSCDEHAAIQGEKARTQVWLKTPLRSHLNNSSSQIPCFGITLS